MILLILIFNLRWLIRLGYNDRKGLKNVERFMKHYFLTAKEVGDLTRIICSVLEERQKNKVFI